MKANSSLNSEKVALVSQKQQVAEIAAEMDQQLRTRSQELEQLQIAREAEKTAAAARIGGLKAVEQQLADSRQHVLTIQVKALLQILKTCRLARRTGDIHNPSFATAKVLPHWLNPRDSRNMIALLHHVQELLPYI